MIRSDTTGCVIKRGIALFFVSCALISALLSFSYAWFYSGTTYHFFNGHVILGYFDPTSGNGKSPDSPYIISEPKHFYNFVWLQNVGAFDEKTYLKIKDGVDVIDMAGYLTGDNSVSGAIPPIGSSSNPFIGEFDGNGAVIKNLWVSTDEEDWYEKPATHDRYTVGSDVGLFGNIGYGANISNFYLENIEVTNTVNNANLGIIAGYVDGNISTIGIKNAKLSFKDGVTASAISDYSLVGYKTSNVIWEDLPSNSTDGGSGGNLIINPSADKTAQRTYGTTNKMDIPNSVSGTAYYVGSLQISDPKPQPGASNTYKYTQNSTITFNGTTVTYTADTSTTTNLDFDDTTQMTNLKIEQEFMDIFDGTVSAIYPKSNGTIVQPNFSAVTGKDTYPTNCVWFKPIAAGECSVAFSRQNKSDDETMSIYRYQRNADGTIKSGSRQEIIFNLSKNNGLSNGSVVYFSLSITEADLNYEYVIGTSSVGSGGSAGFVFLKLAGTDVEGGLGPAPDGNTYRMLKDIDFVETTETDLSEIKMHRSILSISGTQTSAGAIYFDEADGVVLHCNSSSLSLTQKITVNVEARAVTTTEHTFPPRQDTLPPQVP